MLQNKATRIPTQGNDEKLSNRYIDDIITIITDIILFLLRNSFKNKYPKKIFSIGKIK